MKKLILSTLILLGTFSLVTASPNTEKKKMKAKKTVKTEQKKSRQYCEKACVTEDGVMITVEAGAGWFLSNNDNALERACAKALAAAEAMCAAYNANN